MKLVFKVVNYSVFLSWEKWYFRFPFSCVLIMVLEKSTKKGKFKNFATEETVTSFQLSIDFKEANFTKWFVDMVLSLVINRLLRVRVCSEYAFNSYKIYHTLLIRKEQFTIYCIYPQKISHSRHFSLTVAP